MKLIDFSMIINHNMPVPKIIHQIFEQDSVPEYLLNISKTWKELNPEWKYILWNQQTIKNFLLSNFPNHIAQYQAFPYDIQRWHVGRFLILFHYGGIYTDMDYECLEPINDLLKNKSCCLGLEPEEYAAITEQKFLIGNALIAVKKKHRFIKYIIDRIFENNIKPCSNIYNYVKVSTGVNRLNTLYDKYPFKKEISLLPSEYISPFSASDVSKLLEGRTTKEMENKIEKAYAVHYHLGVWRIKQFHDCNNALRDKHIII